jgi:hypothetical protein
MATYTSIEQYRADLNKKMVAMRRAGIKSCGQAASYMQMYAKKLAPRSSGQTIDGIRKRPSKEGYVVVSTVPGPFMQNFFANQTAPYRTLNFGPRGGGYAYAPNQTVVYGLPALARNGRLINWTASGGDGNKGRFFHRATLRTRKYFPQVAVQNNRRALRTGFGGV